MNDDRVVLITGASSGIGWATALAFAGTGAKVAATARRAERLEALVAAAEDLPGDILPIVADVTSADAMQQAVDTITNTWGRLDVLVANAGLGQRGSVVDADWSDLETLLRTNIDGLLHSIRSAVPLMQQGTSGSIVLVSSISGMVPAPYAATYGASKAFVNALGRALRYELIEDNIGVTSLLVGQTHSEFSEKRLGKAGRVASNIPTMQPEQVARQIVRLSHKKQRLAATRLLDWAFVIIGTLFPGMIDRLMRRIYQ